MEGLNAKYGTFFIAVILMECNVEADDQGPLFREDIVLLKGSSVAAAEQRAIAYGRSQEDRYENVHGETVRWSFKEIVDVREVWDTESHEMSDLYSRHFRSYDRYVSLRSEYP